MTHRFKAPARKALAITLAASLAFTAATATPAQAGSEDKVGAIAAASLFALLTAGLIATSVHQQNRDEPPRAAPYPPRGSNGPRPGTGWNPPRANPRKTLPAQCAFTVRHGRDAGSYFGSACLKREFSHWAYLPDRCEEHIDMPGRDRRGYDAQCLARYGYTTGSAPRSSRW